MCIIFLAISCKHIRKDGYKLIVASNRDEYFNRATREAHFWRNYPHILSGTDGQGTGTWFGISKTGRIGMLTNYRQASSFVNPQAKSRGELVSNFLISHENPSVYIEKVRQSCKEYNGFNLIVGDISSGETEPEFSYFCNQEHEPFQRLGPGIYGLSNRYLDFGWKKVVLGKEKFENIVKMECSLEDKVPHLMDLLQDKTRYPDDNNFIGPRDIGLSLSHLEGLTAISPLLKIEPEDSSQRYGTRTNTVVLVDHEDNVTFVERAMVEPINYDSGVTWKTNKFHFKINPNINI